MDKRNYAARRVPHMDDFVFLQHFLNTAAQRLGAGPAILAHKAAEVRWIGKAHLARDFLYGQRRVQKQTADFQQQALADNFSGGFAEMLAADVFVDQPQKFSRRSGCCRCGFPRQAADFKEQHTGQGKEKPASAAFWYSAMRRVKSSFRRPAVSPAQSFAFPAPWANTGKSAESSGEPETTEQNSREILRANPLYLPSSCHECTWPGRSRKMLPGSCSRRSSAATLRGSPHRKTRPRG